ILELAQEREVLRVVADQDGAPTWSRNLAEMTAHVIRRCTEVSLRNEENQIEGLSVFNGIYHAAGSGETTWHGFAKEAIRLQRRLRPEKCLAKVSAISTVEYPTLARRPQNSRLNCKKLEETFGFRMMGWQESLKEVLAEI
ncbi:MAG: SDR family oxidoreductase, partial [Nitrososphaerales archaeon]